MTITVKGEVDEQGRLHVQEPIGLPAGKFTVTITSEPMLTPEDERRLGYPPGWFERTWGCLADDPIEIPEELPLEERELLE